MLNACEKISDTVQNAYEFHAPASILRPVLVSAPHGGTYLPSKFQENAVLSTAWLLSTVDRGTDRLAHVADSLKLPTLTARYARSFVDLNRARDEFDKSVVKNALMKRSTARLHAGYGVIPRCVAKGKHISEVPIARDDAEARLAIAYDPFHAKLTQTVAEMREEFGYAVIVDIHSTPASALQSPELELVIGTRRGASLGEPVKSALTRSVAKSGFRLVYDYPFQGGYITEHYGKPRDNVHALQIEINRDLIETQDDAGFAMVDEGKLACLKPRLQAFLENFILTLPRG